MFLLLGFLGGSAGKESACNAGDLGLNPELGRSPGEGNGNPVYILAWKIPWTERILAGYSPWGCKELDMIWWLNHHHHHQWLRLCTSTSRGTGWNPGQGTKILHTMYQGQNKFIFKQLNLKQSGTLIYLFIVVWYLHNIFHSKKWPFYWKNIERYLCIFYQHYLNFCWDLNFLCKISFNY